MKRISQLKDEALDALHGNFGKAALATLGVFAISVAIGLLTNTISGTNVIDYYGALFTGNTWALKEATGSNPLGSVFQLVVTFFFLTPLGVGVANTYRILLESKGAENKFFGSYFKIPFSKRYGHILLVSLISGLLIALMIVPAMIVVGLLIALIPNWIVRVILILAALVFVLWIAFMYSQLSFIMIENPELDAIDTMRRSRNLMDGSKWRYFVLGLSFIGWAILCIITLGIGFLWLEPYIRTTQAAFYCEIRDSYQTEETV
jgi:uncharacterized membrane protein